MRYGNEWGAYEITALPGSPRVAVSHGTFVYPKHRGKGFGKAEHVKRLEKIKELGYDYVICTVDLNNYREIKILSDNQWKKCDEFTSSSSGHKVGIFGKLIERAKEN